ncbi:hypothetical protein [Vibrio vulnificus]|uniref:hypothetical protein n=1 Tax=Vibrio vulnificus TaxID=672 RepID=UPI0032422BD0
MESQIEENHDNNEPIKSVIMPIVGVVMMVLYFVFHRELYEQLFGPNFALLHKTIGMPSSLGAIALGSIPLFALMVKPYGWIRNAIIAAVFTAIVAMNGYLAHNIVHWTGVERAIQILTLERVIIEGEPIPQSIIDVLKTSEQLAEQGKSPWLFMEWKQSEFIRIGEHR